MKEFIELNVNFDTMQKIVKFVELNRSIAAVLWILIFQDDLTEYKCFFRNKDYQHNFDKSFNT